MDTLPPTSKPNDTLCPYKTIFRSIFRRKLTASFFALVTLAGAVMAYFIVSNTDALGAANGLSILPATGLAMFQFNDKRHYFYVALGLLTITILVTILIRRSRLGFHLSAIRENERAAAALGINEIGRAHV